MGIGKLGEKTPMKYCPKCQSYTATEVTTTYSSNYRTKYYQCLVCHLLSTTIERYEERRVPKQ